MHRKITLKSIAENLGVSVSTVSKALRNSDEISEALKERIQIYVRETGYRPNHLAVSLQRQKTMTIGVIVPELVHHFFSRVISGAEDYASRFGYKLLISLTNDEWDKERQMTELLTNGYVDGLLVSVAKQTFEKGHFGHFSDLLERQFPLVFFDRAPYGMAVDKVLIDDVEGGYKATKHLIGKGAKRIVILTTPSHITVGADREKGYKKALQEAGLPVRENLIFRIDERKPVKAQIESVFSLKPLPDAVFAVNEQYAALTLKIALHQGLQVPGDMMIIGFTNGFISRYTNPSLSTIAQHGFEMGEKAMEMLLKKIENESNTDKTKTVIIPTNLVERESTYELKVILRQTK